MNVVAPAAPGAPTADENAWPLLPSERTWGAARLTLTLATTAAATWCYLIGESVGGYLGFVQGAAALTAGCFIGMLLVLLALTAGLNLWNLAINGWANTYYSAAVRSMASSWHNFLFASLDPSGLMTVDKPPLSLWIQALSARIFGFHPLALL